MRDQHDSKTAELDELEDQQEDNFNQLLKDKDMGFEEEEE